MSAFPKVRFYTELIFFKLISPLECSNHRVKVFINEIEFLFHAVLRSRCIAFTKPAEILLKTRLGNFYVRETLFDVKTASPAFERIDLNKISSLITKELKSGADVTFIDIGAAFGKYTIAIGELSKKYGSHLKTIAFEPDPENFRLLSKNIRINKLKYVRSYNTALSSRDGLRRFYYFNPAKMIVSFKTDTQVIIKTAKLDSVLRKSGIKNKSAVFVKIDVEGHEVEVLRGAKQFFERAARTTILIEDVFNPGELERYLLKNFSLLAKLSVQNSFWQSQHQRSK